ncbi:Pyrrolocin cluster transcription factor [Lachnellula willkommii]|uniref:Pyrrolocin cluster transcription factor n=1 Tax=Lachnellula willkommii TaxID=215461 RepID=A0A559M790_9HELO|nr:Pyrrolocin cluster transcription factor [Lachnellula willkommii]
MQQRIDRLEALVTTLASQDQSVKRKVYPGEERNGMQNGTKPDNNHPLNEIKHGLGVMEVTEHHSQYRGSTHWGDVLGEPISFNEVLATLPSKSAVGKLVQRFFDEKECPVPAFNFLHCPTFLQQYEDFCANPTQSKVMWLGLLFSMLTLVMLSYHILLDEPPEYEGVSESLFELYRLRTAQCLMLGDITKCAPFTIETLIFNSMAEQATRHDSGASVWLMFGVINRVALQMGYQRLVTSITNKQANTDSARSDPSQYKEISVFQGEMRRRIWFFVIGIDALTSFQAGLPSMIGSLKYDTLEPRSLHNSELYEGMTELPLSRPKAEQTPVAYMLSKGTVVRVIGEIGDFLNSLDTYSYDTVLKLDAELLRCHSELPPFLQFGSLGNRKDNESYIFNGTVQLELLYHQGMCVLHRKFLAKGRFDQKYERSRLQCVKSALALLSLQNLLYRDATLPDGRLRFTRHWYRFTYTSETFILAAMILCLDLKHRKVEASVGNIIDTDQLETILSALRGSREIWSHAKGIASESAADAWKVHRVLTSMLWKSDRWTTTSRPPGVEPVSQDAGELFPNGAVDTMELADDPFDLNIDWTAWNSFIEGGGSFEDAFGAMPPVNSVQGTTFDTDGSSSYQTAGGY